MKEREKQNVEDLGSSSSSSSFWGSSVENPPPYSGSDGLPHGPMKEWNEKKKQGERNWVGGEGHRIQERRRGEGQVVINRNIGSWRC